MTWIQILAQAGVMAGILGFFVALGSYSNGKQIKSGMRAIQNLIKIKEKNKLTREIIAKIDERAEERHREVFEFLKRLNKRT